MNIKNKGCLNVIKYCPKKNLLWWELTLILNSEDGMKNMI